MTGTRRSIVLVTAVVSAAALGASFGAGGAAPSYAAGSVPAAASQPGPSPTTQGGTTSPAGVWMPTAPFSATFFYPWYKNGTGDGRWTHWQGEESAGYFHHAPANWNSHYLPDPKPNAFDPSTELYNSNDLQTFYWQLGQMKAAHQTVAISSWWGQNDVNGIDANFRTIVTDYMNRPDNPYATMRWAVYYEKEGYGDPSVAQIESDLNYIKTNYASQPGYLWVDGKPVVFVYNAKDVPSGDWWTSDITRWKQARADTGFYVNMKIDPVIYGGVPSSVMDSWHEYSSTGRSDTYGGFYFIVSPGFWREQDAPVLARDPPSFASATQAMAASSATWKITETWNEYIEGSAVEPATNANWTYDTSPTITNPNVATSNGPGYGSTYVSILGSALPPPGPAPPTPTAPQGLAATGGNATVRLSWAAPSSGSSGITYSVYRSTTPGAEQADTAPPLATGILGTTYRDGSVTNGTPYYYVVRAVGSVPRAGPPSNEASATPTLCTTYVSSSTGSHQVCGAIRDKYLALGGPAGFLGYPVTDETGTPDGVGRYNHFARSGSIYWTPSTGAWSVHGGIRAKWSSLGWERSCLGYPVSDELAIPGGRQSNFQSGVITYSFASGRTAASCR